MGMTAKTAVSCSVVIATLDRSASLRLVLQCLARQTRPPLEVIISSAGDGASVESVIAEIPTFCPVRLVRATDKSAARQRNQAAAIAAGDVLAFLDDDIEFEPELFSRALAHFDRQSASEVVAIATRIKGESRRTPGRLTRWYYRLQAGYSDADYGGRLFGPGINCYPVYRSDSPELIRSEWLPATCLFVRSANFAREKFPEFTGYSFAEDVHLTARLRRHAPIYFARDCEIVHHSLPSEFKTNRAALTAGKLRNMRVIARDILGLSPWGAWWRLQLHRLFLTVVTLLRPPTQAKAELRGIWSRIT